MREEVNQLFEDIEQWHYDRNLTQLDAQMTKVMEEVGELAKCVAHRKINSEEMADAIGDSIIAIIGVASILGVESYHCLLQAWDEVKDRTGKTINGHFVKDEVE